MSENNENLKEKKELDWIEVEEVESIFNLILKEEEPQKNKALTVMGQILLTCCPHAEDDIKRVADENLKEEKLTQQEYDKIMVFIKILANGGPK